MTPSRLIAFLAALVLSLAGGSDAAAKSARREILAAVESASSEMALASAERVWENLASEADLASGPRDYPYAQVIEEYTSQGAGAKTLAATFTFADDLVSQTRYANGTSTTQFIQFDGFGSTRWLTNGEGTITDSIDYDAFGNEVSRTGTTAVEHLYRGEAFDPNVAFYYLRARWMDPNSGRFVTHDTYMGNDTDPVSLHKYLYASSAPTLYTDPSGHMSLPAMGIALTIVGKTLDVSFYVYAAYTGGTSALAGAIVEDLAFMIIPGSGIAKAPSRIAQILARTKKFKLGYPAFGATLAHNLRVFGRYGPFRWAAHHIVPGGDARAKMTRTILDWAKVDINSPLNGIFMDAARHAKIHTDRYYRLLEQRLTDAWNSRQADGVREEMIRIYDEIEAGTFP